MNCQVCQKKKTENKLFYPDNLQVNLCDEKGEKFDAIVFDKICLTCADNISDIIYNALKMMIKEHKQNPQAFDKKMRKKTKKKKLKQ
tara:strand:- start:1667 stop:1927 length:261 start_codon:yes stop_codon:yes gene_type:complete